MHGFKSRKQANGGYRFKHPYFRKGKRSMANTIRKKPATQTDMELNELKKNYSKLASSMTRIESMLESITNMLPMEELTSHLDNASSETKTLNDGSELPQTKSGSVLPQAKVLNDAPAQNTRSKSNKIKLPSFRQSASVNRMKTRTRHRNNQRFTNSSSFSSSVRDSDTLSDASTKNPLSQSSSGLNLSLLCPDVKIGHIPRSPGFRLSEMNLQFQHDPMLGEDTTHTRGFSRSGSGLNIVGMDLKLEHDERGASSISTNSLENNKENAKGSCHGIGLYFLSSPQAA